MPFANHNMQYLSGEDIISHYFPERPKKPDDKRRLRTFTVSIDSMGEMKNLAEVEETESAMLLFDYTWQEHSILTEHVYSMAPPIPFIGMYLDTAFVCFF